MNLPSSIGSTLIIAITAVALGACGSLVEDGGGGGATSSGGSGSGSAASGGGATSSGGGGATSSGGSGSGSAASGGGATSSSGGGGAACQPATLVGARFIGDAWETAAVDPATGAITALGPIAGPPSGLHQGGSAYDPATKLVYLLGLIVDQPAVFTIDGVTGATLHTAMLPGFYAMNPEVVGAGTIVVLHQLPGGWETATLDPSTGASASLSPISSGSFSADRAFDPSTDRLFAFKNNNGQGGVVTLDGTTGAEVVDVPTADTAFSSAVVNGAGDIRVLHQVGGSWSVAGLDPSTGAITDLAPVSLTGAYPGISAFDPCTDRIYLLTPEGMLTVDGSLGTVISLVQLPAGQANFAAIEAVW